MTPTVDSGPGSGDRRPRIGPMRLIHVLRPVVAILLWAQGAAVSHGQTGPSRSPVTAELKFTAPFVRHGAPVPVVLEVTSDRMREVAFTFRIMAGNERLLEYRAESRVLSPGKQEFSMLLPPQQAVWDTYVPSCEITLSAQFDGRSQPTVLRTCPMPLLQPDRFGQHMAVCTIHDPPTQSERDLAVSLTIPTSLTIPAAAPQARSANPSQTRGRRTSYGTTPQILGDPARIVGSSAPIIAWLAPDELPGNVVSFCPYDVVAIMPAAFAKLRESQLRAVAGWVRAGGNVVVVLDDARLKPAHVSFLNLLADTDDATPWFMQTPDGSVQPVMDAPRKQSGYSFGFGRNSAFFTGAGRAVVIDGTPSRELPHRESLYALKLFLWRVPASMRAGVAESGAYKPLAGDDSYADAMQSPISADRLSLLRQQMGNNQIQPPASALNAILLRDVRTTVPGAILLLILTAFVFSVGPLQYRLLKRFNLTRWTWVVFPLTAILFTVLTIALANAWIGRDTLHRSLFLVDVGRRNEFLRCNRFDLFFSGRPADTSTAGRHAIVSAFVRDGQTRAYPTRSSQAKEGAFAGAFPGNYELRIQVAQWDPCIVRQFSFEEPKGLPAPPWDAAAATKTPRQNLAPVPGAESWSYAVLTGGHSSYSHDAPTVNAKSLSMSFAVGKHFLSMPHSPCGGNLDDLAVMDIADTTRKLLILTKEEGRNVYVFRRLLHE